MLAASTLFLALAASTYAAPSKRQSADNGSCRALQTTCAGSVKSDLSDAWNIKACVFGATCFAGKRPVDGFLAAVWADRGESGTAPTSVNLPRVTSSLLKSISTDGKTVSQQNFIDGYYSSLDASGGPYPTNVNYVTSLFGNLQDWTAFCSASIPFQNFADFYQYSSSISSSNCGSVTSSLVAEGIATPVQAATSAQTVFSSAATGAQTVVSSAATGAQTVFSSAQTGAQTVFSSAQTVATAAPTPATIAARANPTPVVSSDATCQKMFTTCIDQVDDKVSNPWAVEACVLGATCFGGQRPVDGFLSAVFSTKTGSSSGAPASVSEPRLSWSLFGEVSTDRQTWTQQNFIDAYYGTLSSVGGPFPPNSDLVKSYFDRIVGWTAFCPGDSIPYMNTADYFQYSASVQGGSAQCN